MPTTTRPTASRRRAALVASTLSVAALTQSCINLSSTERAKLRELEAQGIRIPHETYKHPLTAGVLNLLPGFGNFYLAAGTDESGQWAIGFLNLLAWPISVIWAAPQGAIDASTINKRESIYFYEYGPGKDELGANGPARPTVIRR